MQVVNALNEYFASLLLQMSMSHRFTAFAYDVSCIIGNYLNSFLKASSMVLLSDPGGRISLSFQYLKDHLCHNRYMGYPLPHSLRELLFTGNTKREAADRRI